MFRHPPRQQTQRTDQNGTLAEMRRLTETVNFPLESSTKLPQRELQRTPCHDNPRTMTKNIENHNMFKLFPSRAKCSPNMLNIRSTNGWLNKPFELKLCTCFAAAMSWHLTKPRAQQLNHNCELRKINFAQASPRLPDRGSNLPDRTNNVPGHVERTTPP